MSCPVVHLNWAQLFKVMEGSGLLNSDLSDAAIVARCRGELAYLATPYSKLVTDDDGHWCMAMSADASVRAARLSLRLAVEGLTAVSPILHSVEMVHADLGRTVDPLDAPFWTRWCAPLLAASGAVIVPTIPGWDQSEGIWHEVTTALEAMKPVYLMREIAE